MTRRSSRNGHSRNGSHISQALDRLLLNEAIGGLTNNGILDRSRFLNSLLDPRRDLDHECGFPKDPIRLEVYQELFDRHPIANRYLSIMDDECWQEQCLIYEDEDPEVVTSFEDGVLHLGDQLDVEEENYFEDQEGQGNPIYPYIKQWSIEAGIGEYGIMLLGFDDKRDSLRDPLKKGSAKNLLFIRVFSQSEAVVASWEENQDDPRYGRPKTYNLDTQNTQQVQGIGGSIWYKGALQGVHWTRVLHLSKDPGSNRYVSRPILRPVLNDILSLSKPLYGSGEGYWRSGLPTFLAKTDPKLGGSVRINRDKIRDQLEQWTNTAQKVLIANGWMLEGISGSVQDPKAFIDCHIDAICIKGAYPKRVFLGSERGELASSDDAKKHEARKREYRKSVITPKELVPFYNRCIYAGVLPTPKRWYAAWSTDEHLTDGEKADIFLKKMQGLSAAIAGGVTTFIGDMATLRQADYTDEEATQMLDDAAKQQEEEQKNAEPLPGQLPPGQQPPQQGGQLPPPKNGPIPPNRQLPPPRNGQQPPTKNGQTQNKFCPTGAGGGVDPSCGGEGGGGKGKEGGTDTSGLKGSGTKDDPYKCGKDIKLAAKLLSEGHHIQLKQPDQVSTLLDKMHKMVWNAVEKGDKAPTFDLCKVSVKNSNLFCQDNLGIPRVNMPQMKGEAIPGSKAHALGVDKKGEVDLSAQFIQHLKDKGISTEETSIRASHLRASQNEIVGSKIAKMVIEAQAGKRDLREKPIFVTRDNYVVDGHHHWAAIVGLGAAKGKDFKVPVHRLDMDIGAALSEANAYTKEMGIKSKSATANKRKGKQTDNAFCATGVGGGIDPSCGAGHGPGEGLAHGGEATEQVAHALHLHAAAMIGSSLSTVGATIAALKALGVNAGHAEHVAKAWVADKVSRAVSKLPGPLQTVVKGAWAVAKVGTAAAFVTYTASQALAEKVSLERGHSPEQARRLRGLLSSLDVTAAKPIALTLGPTASFAPAASLSYLAYSTARDPLATLRAARGALGDLGKRAKGLTSMIGNQEQIDALVQAVEDHNFDDNYIALLSVALDATQDIRQAVEAANKAYEGK